MTAAEDYERHMGQTVSKPTPSAPYPNEESLTSPPGGDSRQILGGGQSRSMRRYEEARVQEEARAQEKAQAEKEALAEAEREQKQQDIDAADIARYEVARRQREVARASRSEPVSMSKSGEDDHAEEAPSQRTSIDSRILELAMLEAEWNYQEERRLSAESRTIAAAAAASASPLRRAGAQRIPNRVEMRAAADATAAAAAANPLRRARAQRLPNRTGANPVTRLGEVQNQMALNPISRPAIPRLEQFELTEIDLNEDGRNRRGDLEAGISYTQERQYQRGSCSRRWNSVRDALDCFGWRQLTLCARIVLVAIALSVVAGLSVLFILIVIHTKGTMP